MVDAGSESQKSPPGLDVEAADGGLEGRSVLEVVLTHLLVTIVSAHTFDARIGKLLTRVEEL